MHSCYMLIILKNWHCMHMNYLHVSIIYVIFPLFFNLWLSYELFQWFQTILIILCNFVECVPVPVSDPMTKEEFFKTCLKMHVNV